MGINLASAEINVLNSCRYESPLVNLEIWQISVLKTMLPCLPLIIQVFGSWFGERQFQGPYHCQAQTCLQASSWNFSREPGNSLLLLTATAMMTVTATERKSQHPPSCSGFGCQCSMKVGMGLGLLELCLPYIN